MRSFTPITRRRSQSRSTTSRHSSRWMARSSTPLPSAKHTRSRMRTPPIEISSAATPGRPVAPAIAQSNSSSQPRTSLISSSTPPATTPHRRVRMHSRIRTSSTVRNHAPTRSTTRSITGSGRGCWRSISTRRTSPHSALPVNPPLVNPPTSTLKRCKRRVPAHPAVRARIRPLDGRW